MVRDEINISDGMFSMFGETIYFGNDSRQSYDIGGERWMFYSVKFPFETENDSANVCCK